MMMNRRRRQENLHMHPITLLPAVVVGVMQVNPMFHSKFRSSSKKHLLGLPSNL